MSLALGQAGECIKVRESVLHGIQFFQQAVAPQQIQLIVECVAESHVFLAEGYAARVQWCLFVNDDLETFLRRIDDRELTERVCVRPTADDGRGPGLQVRNLHKLLGLDAFLQGVCFLTRPCRYSQLDIRVLHNV